MTTLIVKLSTTQAKAVARCADALRISHEELARQAVLLFLKALR